jgi:cation diffusion facilitator CzcD-associated flavoprotein CzcO
MSSAKIDHEIVIVGAGFSGIGIGIALDKAGITDYLIVEEGGGFGGTWYWNTYPGVAVDIPSFSYQFSFAQRSDWSRVYARGAELRGYAEDCATDYGLHARTRFGIRVTSAEFDEERNVWRLKTTGAPGAPIVTRHLVDATGVLTQPRTPDIDGVDDFAGLTIHTSRWDHRQDLSGKRVAVIGTGASAAQLIPAIAPDVAHLTVFQRTPIWCLPKADAAIPASVRLLLRRVPGMLGATRLASQTLVELLFPLAAHFPHVLPFVSNFEARALDYMRREIRDPNLREKLIPRYALGCKRPAFHNTYLSTYARDNVTLATTPIRRIEPSGVLTHDGTVHEIDVLVLATGFKVFEPDNMPPFPVLGRGGADLGKFWTEHRHQAYEGVSVPGFPNYFLMCGPYSYNGSSYFNLVETQARHIVRCLRHAHARKATRVEVTARANEEYFDAMLRRGRRQIFWRDSCSLANSYYFDANGDVPLRPSPTLETIWRSYRFPLRDYQFAT